MRWFYGDQTSSVWNDPALQGALKHTLLLAVICVAVAVPLGVALALGLQRWRGRGSGSVNVLMLLPLVTPEIVMGVALLLLFLQVFNADRPRHDGAVDRADHVHALVRGRDGARPPGLDRAGVRGGRRRPRGAAVRRALPRAAAAARAGDPGERGRGLRALDRRLRRHAVPVRRREHDDRVDAAVLLGPRSADAGAQCARDDRACDHARDARARIPRLPALRRRRGRRGCRRRLEV